MSKAFRLFTSAPIVKRHDALTLQTADGICVCIRGFINKQRTIENGFSSEVFTHFFIGFPPYWEKYAKECLGETIMADVGLEVVPNSSNAARDSGPSLISTPCNHAVNLPTMVEERTNLDSSQQKCEASTIKVQDEQNLNRKTLSCLTSKLNHVKESSLEKETRKKLDFEEVASSVSRERKGNKSIISPESLNFKRSRSGRVLLPRMEFWRNQIPVYDQAVDRIRSIRKGETYCHEFLDLKTLELQSYFVLANMLVSEAVSFCNPDRSPLYLVNCIFHLVIYNIKL
ncbi:hypothetical protein ES332_D09G184000v1 [Gossypium tomentosum]|uniref:SANTA domain-containing protein n=1 Tax=Gossypium tomentosum TaxID=34277 RepID=A0A5D2JIA6_GOSTO|nr:hypothetical protein ES332_D09G184000v1 [Gossypium tomentosum]